MAALLRERTCGVFQEYIGKENLGREYGQDSVSRKLHQVAVHALRYSPIIDGIHAYI